MGRLTTDAASLLVPKLAVSLTRGILAQDYYGGHILDEATGRRYFVGVLHLAENALINLAIKALPEEDGLGAFVSRVQEEFVTALKSSTESVTLDAVCATEEETRQAHARLEERAERERIVARPMTLQAAYFLLQPIRGVMFSNRYFEAVKSGLGWPDAAVPAMIDCSQVWICGRSNRTLV